MKHSPWKPASHADLIAFQATFCDRCGDFIGCPIRADGQVYDIGHPAFPSEWTIGTDGPECAGLVEVNTAPWDDYWEE